MWKCYVGASIGEAITRRFSAEEGPSSQRGFALRVDAEYADGGGSILDRLLLIISHLITLFGFAISQYNHMMSAVPHTT